MKELKYMNYKVKILLALLFWLFITIIDVVNEGNQVIHCLMIVLSIGTGAFIAVVWRNRKL